jgi:hypothetical protein
MAEFTPKPSKNRPFTRKEEREFREALSVCYATDFPNPERLGCPDKSRLNALARRRVFPEVPEVVSHISHCSPCSQELTELIRQHNSRQWVYRVAAVGLIIVGIAAWASWKLMRNQGTRVPEPPPIVKTPPELAPPGPGQVPPSVQEQKSAEVQVVVLDLRNRGVVRGENKRQSEDLDLPKGRLKLSIYLPIGSEEGNYEVRITGQQNQVQTAKGKAGMQNHLNILTVAMDTSTFDAGKYSLAIRQAGWGWNRYPLELKENK